MVIIGLTLTTCFTLGLLAWGWIDSILFGNELSVYFANRYYRYMTGFINIPIYGVAAFTIDWATRGKHQCQSICKHIYFFETHNVPAPKKKRLPAYALSH